MSTVAATLEAFGAKLHERRQTRYLGAQLLGDMHDDAPGPCVDCPQATRCGRQRLACEQFALFVRFGGMDRWRNAPRQPAVGIFNRLFESTGTPLS